MKSPCPEGMTCIFKKHLEIISTLHKNSLQSKVMLPKINETMIILQKRNQSTSILHYRSIITFIATYKVIAKILVNRSLPFEAAFVAKRLIVENIILTHRLSNNEKEKKEKCVFYDN